MAPGNFSACWVLDVGKCTVQPYAPTGGHTNQSSSMAGLRVPLSTLRLPPYDRRRMTRGQDDWLGLSCVTLSFTTFCRF